MRNKNLLIVTLVLGLIAFAAVRLTREAPKTEAANSRSSKPPYSTAQSRSRLRPTTRA